MFQNQLDSWLEGAQRIGENLVEQAIDSLLSNQGKGLSQLQELQKWNLTKTIQKLLTSKFFVREPTCVSVEASPLLGYIARTLGSNDPDEEPRIHCYKNPVNLGGVELHLHGADGLLLAEWRNLGAKAARSYVWKVVARLGVEVRETEQIMVCEDYFNGEPVFSRLSWGNLGAVLRFDYVNDLHQDLVVELQRRRDANLEASIAAAGGHQPPPISDLTSFFGAAAALSRSSPQKGTGLQLQGGATDSMESSANLSRTATQEEAMQQAAKSPKGSNDRVPTGDRPGGDPTKKEYQWHVYGMVLIPLMCLVSGTVESRGIQPTPPSSNPTQTHEERTAAQTPTGPATTYENLKAQLTPRSPQGDGPLDRVMNDPTITSLKHTVRGWFALFPLSQQEYERKWSKPTVGYPGLGALNPRIAPGFLHLTATLSVDTSLVVCKENMNAPSCVWIQPLALDLQAFEVGGTRLHNLLTSVPVWVRNLCHVGTLFQDWYASFPGGALPAQPLIFWSLLLYTLILARLQFIPVLITGLILFTSYTQKGAEKRTRESAVFGRGYRPIRPRDVNEFRGQAVRPLPNSYFTMALGIKSGRSRQISQWMFENTWNCRVPRDQKLLAKIFEENAKRIASPVNEAGASSSSGDLDPGMVLPAGPIGIERTNSDSIDENPKLAGIMAPSAIVSIKYPPNLMYESHMASPFGRLDFSICDSSVPSQPISPIFADDTGPLDIQRVRHLAITVLETVQLAFTGISSVIEKIQFGLGWGDPISTRLAWVILGVLGLEFSLITWILSLLPGHFLRTVFIGVPVAFSLMVTDPVIIKVLGLDIKLDQLARALCDWGAGSHTAMRVAVDIWDVLYRERLITAEERKERLEALKRPMLLEKPVPNEPGCSPETFVAPPAPPPTQTRSDRLASMMKLGADRFWPVTKNATSTTTTTNNTATASPKVETSVQATSALVAPKVVRTEVDVKVCKTKVKRNKNLSLSSSQQSEPLTHRGIWGAVGLLVSLVKVCVVGPFLFQFKFVLYWFLRLPDRREIEHRQIATAQYLGESLDVLVTDNLPAGNGPSSQSPAGVDAYLKKSYLHICKPSAAMAGDGEGDSAGVSPPGGRKRSLWTNK